MSSITQSTQPNPTSHGALLDRVQHHLAAWLSRYSITLLRISLGGVFLLFGALKFFPGSSPAEEISTRTVGVLTFGLLSHQACLLLTAVMECTIGLTLVTGKFLKFGVLVLFGALVGIMSPLVLFAGDLFPAPDYTPTLLAQYVLKDFILAAAGLVVAAKALGAQLEPRSR